MSAGRALAPGVGWLIAARAAQGAGSALIMSIGLALLSAAFPPERRGAAIGSFSAITGLSVASGPLVGGAVVQGLSWEWIFWVNVPIGLVAGPLVLTRVRESFGPDVALDVRGLLLVSAAAFALVWGLVRADDAGWRSVEVVESLVAAVLPVVAFVAWERRAPEPMLPLRLFRSRGFSAGNAAIFFTFASLFVGVFFVAQLLQTGLGWIALIADAGVSYSSLLAPFVIAGVGVSMAIPAAQTSVIASVEPEEIGKAAGVDSMLRELGGVFGIAVAVAVFAASGSYASLRAFGDGLGPAVAVGAVLALAGAVAALGLPGRRAVIAA